MEYVGNIIYDDKLLNKDRKFVIYGAGLYGKKVLQYMDMNGMKDHVICFCNSENKFNVQAIQEVPIVWTKTAIMQYPDADYLICGKYAKEMYQILKENEVCKIHFLFI